MNIANINSTEFHGGFRFHNMPKEAKEALPYIASHGKQIFYDFEKPDTIFIVVRDDLNGKVFNFAKRYGFKKLDFYPEINTKCGLDTQKPELLAEVIKDKFFEHIDNVIKYCKKQHRLSQRKHEKENFDFVNNILKKLCIDIENPEIIDKYGGKIIEDKIGRRKIYISPINRNGIHYVLVDSTSSDFSRDRYAMKSSGEIIKKFTSIDDIKPFKEAYNSLLEK